jgi:inhibitor of cysteine peptidase
MLVVTKNQNKETVVVGVGDMFRVELPENPTTGYRWHVASSIGAAIRLIDDSFQASSRLSGSGGLRNWTFSADHAAIVQLDMQLKRSWQPQAVDTFSVTIQVASQSR